MPNRNNPKPPPFSVKVDPDDAANVLMRCYSSQAGEEALLRALFAERDVKGELASFWVGVYQRIAFYRQSG